MKKIQIIGNITRDAEVKTFEGGRSVINFDVAVNEQYKSKDGEKVKKVSYIKCAVWRDSTAIVPPRAQLLPLRRQSITNDVVRAAF